MNVLPIEIYHDLRVYPVVSDPTDPQSDCARCAFLTQSCVTIKCTASSRADNCSVYFLAATDENKALVEGSTAAISLVAQRKVEIDKRQAVVDYLEAELSKARAALDEIKVGRVDF